MKMWQHEQTQGPIVQYRKGDAVRVVQGLYNGRQGIIFAVVPSRDRPYVVKLGYDWYVHLPAEVLAPADERA